MCGGIVTWSKNVTIADRVYKLYGKVIAFEGCKGRTISTEKCQDIYRGKLITKLE